jgi:spore germination protein YaaH
MKHFLLLLALLIPLAGPMPVGASSAKGASPHAVASQAPSQLRREVFGFALASSLADPTVGYPSWNFSLLSTVAFFGLHINDDGTIANDQGLTEWNSSDLTNMLSAAHAKGARVVLTVIKQDFASGTPSMCAALANRATTVGQTIAQVTAKGVDGLNVDYEGLNGTCPNGQTARSMMTDFAAQLRAALPAGSYLSVDTYASSATDPLGFFDVPGLNAYVDSFFVMAYDLEYSNYGRAPTSCSSFCLGPTAPLSGYYYNDTTTASQYVSVVGASKTILGVPYYGRKSCVGSVTPNAIPTGAVTADTYLNASTEASSSEVQAGSYATHLDANDPSGQERWDTWYNTTLGCTREMYWDDTTSLGLKYDLVNQDGLRGVGIFNLNYGGGAPELWSLISSHFVGCTNASVNTSAATPQTVGTQVQLTATSSNCPNPRYQFYLLPPGGTWSIVQPYSNTATYTWNTAGLAAGTYRFSVWARDTLSASAYDTFSAFDYVLTIAPCTSMSASASPPSSASVGTPVTVTGSATGCPNPSYEFWLLPPGGTWFVAQGYSTRAAFSWITGGKAAGSYRFSVWARDASSSAAYDAFSAFQYPLTLATCTGMTATASPATSANVGSTVTVTGAATGCPNPQYEFWLLPPGGIWAVARGYSSNAGFTWNTAGKPQGSYRFSVWARDASSSASYDAFSAFQYSLAVVPCTGMSATTSPATSATAGTTVTVTGAATGCPNPQYQFYLLPPGGTWTLVRGYQPSASFTWNTAGLPAGTYRFSVWARDASSSASYDAFSAFNYPLT